MAHHKKSDSPYLYDNATGDIVGIQDPDGSEQLFPNFSQTFTLDPTAGLLLGGAAPNAEQRAAVRDGLEVLRTIKLTQAEYDALTPDADTLYVIVG